MTFKLEKQIVDILEHVVGSKIENFDVKIQEGNKLGEGFQGIMSYVYLNNKKTGEDYHLVIKTTLQCDTKESRDVISASFFNEIHYYSKIFPALVDFQKIYPNVKIFDNFPKCYATGLDAGFEYLVLENLKIKNYKLHKKNLPLNTRSFENIFKMYAEYHGLSFAFKYHQPKNFFETTKDLNNNWISGTLLETGIFIRYVTHFIGKILGYLKEEGEYELIKKLTKYRQELRTIMLDLVTYKDSYGIIQHGDCWSNNMMFKYNSSEEIEHIKMIDFQTGFIESPVNDLSYCFYGGAAGKETLDNLEYLLKIYHNTLSETLKNYNCDPEKIYPYNIFKKEWKKQCRFGFIMGLMIWTLKLGTDITEMGTLDEYLDHTAGALEDSNFGLKFDEVTYKNIILDLLRHMEKNEFL